MNNTAADPWAQSFFGFEIFHQLYCSFVVRPEVIYDPVSNVLLQMSLFNQRYYTYGLHHRLHGNYVAHKTLKASGQS